MTAIVNITDDSFAGGGFPGDRDEALRRAHGARGRARTAGGFRRDTGVLALAETGGSV